MSQTFSVLHYHYYTTMESFPLQDPVERQDHLFSVFFFSDHEQKQVNSMLRMYYELCLHIFSFFALYLHSGKWNYKKSKTL